MGYRLPPTPCDSTYDEQLIARHTKGKLDFIAAKHVDDIKVAGEAHTHLTNSSANLNESLGRVS